MLGLILGLIMALLAVVLFGHHFNNESKWSLKFMFSWSLFTALWEEALFRVLIQSVIGIWPTSFLFVLLHGYSVRIYGIFMLIVSGMIGHLYELTGFIDVVAFHFIYNFVIYLRSL